MIFNNYKKLHGKLVAKYPKYSLPQAPVFSENENGLLLQLTPFIPLISFYTPWIYRKTRRFLMFSWVITKRTVAWNALSCFNTMFVSLFSEPIDRDIQDRRNTMGECSSIEKCFLPFHLTPYPHSDSKKKPLVLGLRINFFNLLDTRAGVIVGWIWLCFTYVDTYILVYKLIYLAHIKHQWQSP